MNITSENLVLPSLLLVATGANLTGTNGVDGAVLWRQTIGDPKEPGRCALAFLDDKIVVGRAHEVRCIRQLTGETVWKANTPFAVATIVVDGTRIFVARGGDVAAFDKTGGKLLWHEKLRDTTEPTVTLATNGHVASSDE